MLRRCIALVALVFLGLAAGCGDNQQYESVSLTKTVESAPIATTPPAEAFRVAVAALVSPQEAFAAYRDLVDYLGIHIGRPSHMVLRNTYAEVNTLLAENQVDVAFVCSGAYVEGNLRGEQRLLVVPVIDNATTYHSYIIVPKTSPAESIADLRGKRFAFTDPLSNTGYRAPIAMLARQGHRPESFFADTIFTHSHDRSIEAVARGIVDGAAVDSLVWDGLQRRRPKLTGATKVIAISEAFGIPPVVVPAAIDPSLEERLRTIFLAMHEDAEGRSILARIGIDRFATADDSLYDSVRRICLPPSKAGS